MSSLVSRLASQPFELILSSGFFGFFAHAGVVRALEENGLRPSLVGGSSAGALVSGMWAAGLSADAIRERLFTLRREDFWDPDPLFFLRGGILRGQRFATLLDEALLGTGVRTMDQCKTPVRLVVFDVKTRKAVALDRGDLAPAIRASCAVPFMFQPTRIDGRSYLDGGITDRAGILAATPGAPVLYHHLPAKSPWRREVWMRRLLGRLAEPLLNQPPRREGLTMLCEPELPRLSPWHLDRGPRAYDMAREMTLRALDRV
jgi:NTE family protein